MIFDYFASEFGVDHRLTDYHERTDVHHSEEVFYPEDSWEH
jgi:hypothetical protein